MPPIYRKLLVEYDDIIVSGLTVGVLRYPSEGGVLGQALVLGPDNRLTFDNISRDLTLAVTGTGVTNYLPKFTAPRVLGLSQVFDNGTNVGFNTDQPTNTVDINGTLRVRQIANATGSFVTLSTTGVLQQRTPAQVLLDLGAQPTGSYVTTDRTLTINGVTYDLTQNQTWNVGTVTSVGLSAPTGFIVTNSPVTESGTLTLNFAAGYSLPTTSSQDNWNIAYDNRIVALTTASNSGPATLINNVLNIPEYTLAGLGGVPATRTLTINGISYDLSQDRSWVISGGGGGGTPTIYTGSFPIQVTTDVDGSGNLYVTASHADSGVTPGTYNSVEVDAKGHVVNGSVVDVQTDNFVRVLRIPSTAINFANDLKDEIVAYINSLPLAEYLEIVDTDSKWNIVIDGIQANVIDDNTEINLWFDNSGSMPEAFPGLVTMVESCLKQLLLPIYNGDETLYNQRVRIFTFTSTTVSVNGKSISFTGKPLGTERTFYILNTTGSSESISRVVNIVYQDEAQSIYHNVPFNSNTVTVTGSLDIVNLRTTLDSISDTNYYKGVIYQMEDTTPDLDQIAFESFLNAVSTSSGSYTGSNSLEPYFDSGQLSIENGISTTGTADYYLNLLSNTFRNTLGITNVGNVSTITCYQPITPSSVTVEQTCQSGQGRVNITNIVGGTAPYTYAAITGSTTFASVPFGTPITGLPDGTYTIRITDAQNYVYTVRGVSGYPAIVVNCTVPLTGTVTQSCVDATGLNAEITVSSVSGGSGTGYYFRLNSSTTNYTVTGGTGTATGLADGVYVVTLYDSLGTSASLGTVTINCKTRYSINRYECGSCTVLGTGVVEYNPSTPLVDGKFYKLTNGEVGEVTGFTTGPITHVVSDLLTYSDSCATACTQNNYIVTRYLCGVCTRLGKGVVAYDPAIVVGRFYTTTNGEIVEISPIFTPASPTHVLLDPINSYGTCELSPCNTPIP